ncbi:uncharacterized protein LOC131078083 isoform X2 [Cryptomeria japonica]|uniref:uncharacterized protein LOC131078083 isoform X2 n=1 Tax=Cryptomeria japonica TaxID=3369 RepID=UPI0027D9F136|nr:uncharacterized protein LOC131078083 isoform X2 [Cryptomeria japonica]
MAHQIVQSVMPKTEKSNSSHNFVWMPSLKVWIFSPSPSPSSSSSHSPSTENQTDRSKRKILERKTDQSPERQEKRHKHSKFSSKASSHGCPICLGDFHQSQLAVLTACMHKFCLKCIETWSSLQRKCPLCKRHFDGWIYDVQGSYKYKEIRLSRLREEPQASVDRNNRGETDYHRTLQRARGQNFGSQRNTRPLPRRRNFGNSRFISSLEKRRIEEERAAKRAIRWRASIYSKCLRAFPPCLKKKTIIRQNNADNLAERKRLESRLEPWILRELEAILGEQDLTILVHLVFSLLFASLGEKAQKQNMDLMCSENEFICQLEPFLGDKASHFWHELRCFAESPFTMGAYDSVVEYQRHPNCISGE